MRRIFLFILLSSFLTTEYYGQFTTDQITYGTRIDLENSNSWAIGGGVSNFIMHGDLRSIGTGDDTNYLNWGGYLYVDKMFNPLLGLEMKFFYNQLSGGAQYFNNDVQNHNVSYVDGNIVDLNNLNFEGRSYGAELNFILSFTNLYRTKATKWNASGYFGVGYHQYNSALFEFRGEDNVPLVDFGNNPARNSQNEASSIYLSAQFGLKRRINKRIDLEFRTGMYFNYEDHLDAAISRKQDWETFFVSSIGIALKLGKQKIFTIWGDEENGSSNQFKIIDTDKDGVMDQLDTEPNTPAGVMVYGNGKAVDSDKDGLPDHKDNCPLEYGTIEQQGCPLKLDKDGDGIMDDEDLCPDVVGSVENRGCPEQKFSPTNVTQQIALLATSIYFDTNSDKIKNTSYTIIDEIIELIKNTPKLKFQIQGHTDNRNSDRYNLYLSQKRSANVRKYMIRQGVDSKRLQSKGYGESRPKYSNETPGGRQLNRRVEIVPVDFFK